MGAIPPTAFERRLAALDPATRARFVAAVYAAGGSDATARGDRVRIAGGASVGTGRETGAVDRTASTLWIARTGWLGRPRAVPSGVDGVVVAGSGLAAGEIDDGTRPVVDAGRLREFALYGVEREAVRPAFRTHLGCEPDGWDVPPTARGGGAGDGTGEPAAGLLDRAAGLLRPGGGTGAVRDGRSDGRPAVARPRTAVAVVAIVALAVGLAFVPGLGPLAAGAVGPTGGVPVPGADGSGAGGASTPGASGERPASTGALGSVGEPGGRAADGRTLAIDGDGGGDDPPIAPGVTPAGIASAEALADAHRAAVANRSYVWRASYLEFEDGVRITERRAVVRRANDTHYGVDGGEWSDARGVPTPVAGGDLYADGTVEFERTGTDEYAVRPVTAPEANGDRLAEQVGTMIEWYLSANSSSVVGPVQEIGVGDGVEEAFDERLYRVQTTGDPYWGVTNASTLAVVAEEGVVVALYHSHEIPGENLTVVVTFGYDFDETVDVWKPYWVDEAGDDGGDG